MRAKLRVDKRRKLEIPDEFDIDKYNSCKDWGIEEWYEAISYRLFLRRDWNKSTRRYFDAEDISGIYENYKNCARQLLKDPFSYPNSYRGRATTTFINDQCIADIFEDAEDEYLNESSWRSDYLEWSNMDFISRYSDESNADLINRIEHTPTWAARIDTRGLPGRVTIHVSMSGSDSDILKEFRGWLKKTRRDMKLQKGSFSIKANTLTHWHRDRVLPCFDLILYQTIHNGIFKIKNITDALFPTEKSVTPDITDEEKVKRRIIPNALSTISPMTVNILQSRLEKDAGVAPQPNN